MRGPGGGHTRHPPLPAREAPQCAPPAAHPAHQAEGGRRRNFAAQCGVDRGQRCLAKVLIGRQRLDIDAESFCRIDGGVRRRQHPPGQCPKQIWLALDEARQRRRGGRPREIGQALHRVANAARPTARIAGAPLDEPPARIARARRQRIRAKRLIFRDSGSGKQCRNWRGGQRDDG
jgi:hypothetical protein